MRSMLLAVGLLAAGVASAEEAQKTEVVDQGAKAKLMGSHPIGLQWLGKPRGTAEVTEADGVLTLKGKLQLQSGEGVEVDGTILKVTAKTFEFIGKITTQVSHINGGKPCARDGKFTFEQKGGRKYWRAYPVDNPCDVAADYVDLYLR